MKELTIEQKAQRYDEALERAKKLYEQGTITESLAHVFPELKESEDERIRRNIIAALKGEGYYDCDLTNECIAWVKKQGEQNYKIIKGKNYFCIKTHNYAGVEWIKGTKYYASDNYTLVNQGCEYYCPEYSKEEHINCFKEVECDDCLEKQGEQSIKWNKNTKGNKPQVNHSVLMKTSYGIAEGEWKGEYWRQYRWAGIFRDSDVLSWVELSDLEEQGEQRTADSYCQENCKGFQKTGKCFADGDCKAKREAESVDKIEPKFHEGDWIVQGYNILKIKCVGNTHYCFETVGGYVDDMLISEIDSQFHLWTIADAKNGDVLIEDSCIFIIQKLGDNSTAAKTYCTLYNDGDFNDGSILYFDIDSTKPATKEQRDTLERAMADAGYTFDFEKKELKKLGQSEVTKMSDQEEIAEIPFGAKDSELQEVTYFIPKGFHAEIDDDKVVIKKGEKPAAWSEEDELSCFESALFTAFSDAWQSYLLGKDVNVKRWAKEQSKELLEAAKEELKGQNPTWSEEDEEYLRRAINATKDTYPMTAKWLKSLKDRYTWKPSEEQMIALRQVISGCSYDIEPLVELETKLKGL